MAANWPFATPQRTVDLVVLCFGAALMSEARMLRHAVLPAVTSWCTERSLQLRVHWRWPEDTAQRDDEQPSHLTETPVDRLRDLAVDRLRDLVRDDHVFVFAIIGPDMTVADKRMILHLRNSRPGKDPRVFYLFVVPYSDLFPPSIKYDALGSLRFLPSELRSGEVYGRVVGKVSLATLEESLINLLREDPFRDSETISAAKSEHAYEKAEDVGRDQKGVGDHPLPADALIVLLARQLTPEEEESGRQPPAAVVDDNVQFTVYRPNAVQPEVWYPLLAFAHLAQRRPGAPPEQPDPLEQVRALAAQAGVEAYDASHVDASGAVPRAGQLTFVPFVEGVDFNPRSQTFEWQEDVHQQNFRLKARSHTAGRTLRGQITVYLGAFILADITLAFRVDIAAQPPPTHTDRPRTLLGTSAASPTSPKAGLTPVTAVPYQKVFPSYSHKDLPIVRQAEAYGKALGHVYLRDRVALRSGEQWEERLLELIDEADVFQLFWSSNSMRSEYVRREWEHALSLKRRGFIRPTYWEVPMPESANPRLPPDDLKVFHFHGFFEESGGGLDDAWSSVSRPAWPPPMSAEERARREAEQKATREAEEPARREVEGELARGGRHAGTGRTTHALAEDAPRMRWRIGCSVVVALALIVVALLVVYQLPG
jgi:hypothetical protein